MVVGSRTLNLAAPSRGAAERWRAALLDTSGQGLGGTRTLEEYQQYSKRFEQSMGLDD